MAGLLKIKFVIYFLLEQQLGLPAAAGLVLPAFEARGHSFVPASGQSANFAAAGLMFALLAQQLGVPAAAGFALAAAKGHPSDPAFAQFARLEAHAALSQFAGAQALPSH